MIERQTVWGQISEMENDVADVAHWARVLTTVGCGSNHIHPGAVFAIGKALERLNEDLEAKWNLALDAARENRGGR